MKISREETSLLFANDSLLYNQNSQIVILTENSLNFNQIALVKKILHSMGFPENTLSWNFYNGKSDSIQTNDHLKAHPGHMILVIRPEAEGSQEVTHHNISETEVFYIPHPIYFENDDVVKRAVWKVLKPFTRF